MRQAINVFGTMSITIAFLGAVMMIVALLS